MGLSPRGRGNRRTRKCCGLHGLPIGAGLSPRGRGNRRRSSWDRPVARHRVYPRVGGETARLDPACVRLVLGSIPAWAGKPAQVPIPMGGFRVYPRVGGETGSPITGPGTSACGSIPAWAGKPDHPMKRWARLRTASGLSPRGRGNPMPHWRVARLRRGLSPRGRGNLVRVGQVTVPKGSIPAWAGKPTGPSICARSRSRSIPAWAGKPCRAVTVTTPAAGLSPRGRGNLCVIMTQFRKRMNMSKIDGPTEIHLPYGESGATRAARQVVLDGAAPQ